jgi:serine protease AprX
VALTETGASAAISKGARLVTETKGLKALICSPALASSLGLIEDIPIHAADSSANIQIQATRAQQMGLTGRGRTIVVLDTGYNYNHPELASSYLGGRDFVNHDADPFDDNGHGSHVAGIITGDGIDPRARGIAPDTGIVAGKVLDAYGNGFISDLVAAIYWAVDGPNGIYGDYDDFRPDAINLSIASSSGDVDFSGYCDRTFPQLTYAIKYAVDHGIVVVIAAGNNGSAGVAFPGCVSYGIAVGAVNSSNVLASFSGLGPAVAIVAPGVGLYSAFLGSNYKSKDGTSQATPVVSGTIALLKEAFPNASVSDIQNALFSTAADLGAAGRDTRYGWGRIDAFMALGALSTNLMNISLNFSQSNGQMVISWPLTLPGFFLEANNQCALRTNGWCALTNPIIVTEDQNMVVFPKPLTSQFYRLNWR